MRFLTGEVAPLLPLLIPLGEILVWAVALAFCLLVVYIATAFFGVTGSVLGKLPVVGGWVNSSLHSIEHKITSTMGRAAEASDARIGAAFHQLARVVDWVGHEIASHANVLHTLATLLLGQNLAAQIEHLARTLTTRLRIAEHRADVAIHRIEIAEKRLTHGIGHDVLPRVKALEDDVAHTLTRDIGALRARERALERGGVNLWKWIRTHPLAVGSAAFAGAVAFALARLGLGWARCSNWRRAGRSVCGMDADLLESLLADTLLVVGTLSLVQFAEEMQGVTEAAVRPITTFWRAGG